MNIKLQNPVNVLEWKRENLEVTKENLARNLPRELEVPQLIHFHVLSAQIAELEEEVKNARH